MAPSRTARVVSRRGLSLAGASVIALVLTACTGTGGGAPLLTPTPGARTATPSVTPSPTPTSSSSVIPTADESPTPTPPRASSARGVPFSVSDIAAAAETRGYSFWLLEGRAPVCLGASVPGEPHWSANLAGSDFGPVWVLWVYPDAQALAADWLVTPDGSLRSRVDACRLPSGFVYWNRNMVMAFDVWLSLGGDIPLGEHPDSPGDHPALQAFLGLRP